ncbi:MAG: DUF2723 domain-containing protein [Planctomycetota bacterium]
MAGSPTLPGRADRPRYGREYLVALLAAALLYFISVAPGVLWQDSGLIQIRVLRHDLHGQLGLALSHPLFYIVAIAFQALPFAEPAFKTNLAAAVFGAVAVANAFLVLRLVARRRWAAVIGAVALAVAHTFWQHSSVAETYTLTAALLTVELLCLARLVRTGAGHWFVLLLLANGLGVSNHMLATLNLPVWVGLAGWLLRRREIQPATVLVGGLAWLAGASIYLVLMAGDLRAGSPLGEVLKSALFGGTYASNVLNVRLSGGLLLRSVLYLGLNFPTPAVLLAAFGLAGLRRVQPRRVATILAILLGIHVVWAVRYDIADQYTFFVLPALLIAIWIGLGADRVLQRRPRVPPVVLVAFAALPALVYWPLPSLARSAGLRLGVTREIPYRDAHTYFLRPWMSGYDGPQRFAEEARDTLPADAVLIADSTTAPPLYYLVLTNRWPAAPQLWPPMPGTAPPEVYHPAQAQVTDALAEGRVYVVTRATRYLPVWLRSGHEFEPAGVLWRVLPAASQAPVRLGIGD